MGFEVLELREVLTVPTVTIDAIEDYVAVEGGETAQFMVHAEFPSGSGGTLTVRVQLSGQARAVHPGADYWTTPPASMPPPPSTLPEVAVTLSPSTPDTPITIHGLLDSDNTEPNPETIIATILPFTSGIYPYDVGSPSTATVYLYSAPPPVASVVALDDTAKEQGQDPASFRIDLSPPATQPLTVQYQLPWIHGRASQGADYTLSGSASFGIGESSKTITVLPVNDTIFEGDESVVMELVENPGGPYVVSQNDGIAAVVIKDNDTPGPAPKPVVTVDVNDQWLYEEESQGRTGWLLVRRGGGAPITDPLTVNYTLGGAAALGSDYTAQRANCTLQCSLSGSGSITIPANKNSVKVLFTALDDAVVEGKEGILFSANPSSAYVLGAPSTGALSIIDNDTGLPVPTVRLELNEPDEDGVISESEPSTPVLRAVRSGDPIGDLTVVFNTSGTAEWAIDYWIPANPVTIPHGQSSALIYLEPLDNQEIDFDRTVVFTLLDSPFYDPGIPASQTVTILDDDITVSIGDASVTEDGLMAFTVSLAAPVNQTVTVQYETKQGTAVSGGDYEPVPVTTLTFNPLQTSRQIFVDTKHDNIHEDNEKLYVELSNPTGSAVLGDDLGEGVILDNDPTPAISIGDATALKSQKKIVFPITLTNPSENNIAVFYATYEGSAKFGKTKDYFHPGSPGQPVFVAPIAILAGETSGTLTLEVINDALHEPLETFNVELRFPFHAVLADDEAVGTIIDDDPPVASITPASRTTGEDEAAGPYKQLTISHNISNQPVSVTFEVALAPESSAILGQDFHLQLATPSVPLTWNGNLGTLSFPAGTNSAKLNIVPVDDSAPEEKEHFVVRVLPGTGSPPFTVEPGKESSTVYIADNDAPAVTPPTVKITALQPRTPENNAAAPGKFRIETTNGQPVPYDVMVFYSIEEPSTAENGADYQQLYEFATIPVGQSSVLVNVIPIDDKELEPDETVIVRLKEGDTYNVTTVPADQTATVTIEEDDRLHDQPVLCSCMCACGTVDIGENNQTGGHFMLDRDTGLFYNSAAMFDPVIAVDLPFPASAMTATRVEAQLKFNGVAQTPVVYSPPGVANQFYRFAIPANNARLLAAGNYPWEMTVTEYYSSGAPYSRTYRGEREVAASLGGALGDGWSLEFDHRVVASDDGLLLVQGNGGSFFFEEGAGGTYARPPGELGFSTLTTIPGGGYLLTDKHGNETEFNAGGYLVARRDAVGNETVYVRTDGDGDGALDEVSTVIDAAGRTTTYQYSGAKLSGVVDFAGRTTTFTRTGGRITAITDPDPDGAGAGPMAAPVTELAYNAAGRLSSIETADDETTTIAYNSLGMLQSRTLPNGHTRELAPAHAVGVVDTAGGSGTISNPAAMTAAAFVASVRTDENDQETKLVLDRFGFPITVTDPLGRVTVYNRNEEGLVTRVQTPDPDGASGPQPQYEYLSDHDDLGNVEKLTHPDGSTEEWVYGAFSQVASHTDRLGHETLYDLDAQTGLVLAEQRVVGAVDGAGNTETDDVITSFLYTSAPAGASDPPAGLLKMVTDPLGRKTRFNRNARGLVESINYALATLDKTTETFEYDAADNLKATVHIGRRTEHLYDNLDRLIETTLPDPTPGDAVPAPVYTFAYDGMDRLTSQVDPIGRSVTYHYEDGNLERISRPDHDGDGERSDTHFEYTPANQVWRTIDPLLRIHEYVYDDARRLERHFAPYSDPLDANGVAPETVFQYDALDRPTITRDALGKETEIRYSNFGLTQTFVAARLSGQSEAQRAKTVYDFDANGNLIRVTDALLRVTEYEYDELDRVFEITYAKGTPDEATESFDYDKNSNLTLHTDGNGNETAYVYDNRDRLKRIVYDTGYAYDYTYDQASRLLSEGDPDRTTRYSYDPLDRLKAVHIPNPDVAGQQIVSAYRFYYDDVSRLTQAQEPDTNPNDSRPRPITKYVYDPHDNVKTVVQADPDWNGPQRAVVTHFQHDDAGRMQVMLDPLGRETQYTWDNLDRQTRITTSDPDGEGPQESSFARFTFDAVGNLLRKYDGLSHFTRYWYDNQHRQIKQQDPNGHLTFFTHDAVGNLKTLKDPNNNVTTWFYDNRNRVKEEKNQLGFSRFFVYDDNGNVTRRTDRNGRVTEYTYNAFNQPLTETWLQGGTPVHNLGFGYFSDGRIQTAADFWASYTYGYDFLDRRTSVVHDFLVMPLDVTLSSQFDLNGNRTQLAATIGTSNDFVNTYQYDNLHRMTEVVQQKSASPPRHEVAPKKVQFSYDAAGQWEKISRYEGAALDKLVAQSSFVFDEAGRLTDLTHAKGATTFADYGWTYDRANRVTQFDSGVDGTVDYVYDKRDQLTAADFTYQTDETYTYDHNGNRTNAGYSTGANNRLNSDGVYTYQYDNEGNRTQRRKNSNNKTTDYTWDHRNRLIQVTERNFPGGPATKTVQYVYDVWDRRIGKKIDATGNGSFEDASWYVYDGERSERGFAGDHIVLAFDENRDLTNRYLYGPDVDQIIADEQVTSLTQAGNVLWPLTDNLGTVRKVVDYNAATDTGTVVNHIKYDSFGNRTSEINSAIDHIFAFTGRQFDEEVGLQYYRARIYDAAVARFLSEDPAYDDYNNSYRYVGNSPTNFTDPSGLYTPWWQRGPFSIGAAIGDWPVTKVMDVVHAWTWYEIDQKETKIRKDAIRYAIEHEGLRPDAYFEECRLRGSQLAAVKTLVNTGVQFSAGAPGLATTSTVSVGGGALASASDDVLRNSGDDAARALGRNRAVSGSNSAAYREGWERVYGRSAAQSGAAGQQTFRNLLTPAEQAEFNTLQTRYPDWMPCGGLDAPATVRTVAENAAARAQVTARGHHPHPLKFGGEPNPPGLLTTGETRTVKNPIHTEISNYWNRVLRRINSQQPGP